MKNKKFGATAIKNYIKFYEIKADAITGEELNEVKYTNGDATYSFHVTPIISVEKFGEVVRSVSNSAFSVADGTKVYAPYFQDYFFRIAVIEAYTDLVSLNDLDQDTIVHLIYGTPLWGEVCKRINSAQFEDLERAIHRKVEYDKSVLIADADRRINSMVEQLGNALNALDAVTATMRPVETSKLLDLADKLNNMDEAKVAHAVLDYQRSEEASADNEAADAHDDAADALKSKDDVVVPFSPTVDDDELEELDPDSLPYEF